MFKRIRRGIGNFFRNLFGGLTRRADAPSEPALPSEPIEPIAVADDPFGTSPIDLGADADLLQPMPQPDAPRERRQPREPEDDPNVQALLAEMGLESLEELQEDVQDDVPIGADLELLGKPSPEVGQILARRMIEELGLTDLDDDAIIPDEPLPEERRQPDAGFLQRIRKRAAQFLQPLFRALMFLRAPRRRPSVEVLDDDIGGEFRREFDNLQDALEYAEEIPVETYIVKRDGVYEVYVIY